MAQRQTGTARLSGSLHEVALAIDLHAEGDVAGILLIESGEEAANGIKQFRWRLGTRTGTVAS